MTVLPNRPSDGNPRLGLGGDPGAAADTISSSLNLPPTLFKLPNLGVVRRVTETKAEVVETQVAPLNGGSTTDQRAERMNADSTRFRDAAQVSAGLETARVVGSQSIDVPKVTTSKATPKVAESIPRVAAPQAPGVAAPQAPAGRSWMDSLGSHGIVIVLLLIVVVAALLTGQGDDDPSLSSLTTQSELLNFDELPMDLPLPGSDEEVKVAEDSELSVTDELAQSDSSGSSLETTLAAEMTIPYPEQSPSVGPSQPVVSLNEPQPHVGAQLTITNPSSQSNDASGMQFNSFVTPSPGIVALPAGNRVEVDTNAANQSATNQVSTNQVSTNQATSHAGIQQNSSLLPSLEELAGLQDKPSVAATPRSTFAPVRVMTRTPVGIGDWSKYIPPINSESGATNDSSTSPLTLP